MATPQIVTTLRNKAEQVEKYIIETEAKIAAARADLAHKLVNRALIAPAPGECPLPYLTRRMPTSTPKPASATSFKNHRDTLLKDTSGHHPAVKSRLAADGSWATSRAQQMCIALQSAILRASDQESCYENYMVRIHWAGCHHSS
jgi:hypothetical protein